MVRLPENRQCLISRCPVWPILPLSSKLSGMYPTSPVLSQHSVPQEIQANAISLGVDGTTTVNDNCSKSKQCYLLLANSPKIWWIFFFFLTPNGFVLVHSLDLPGANSWLSLVITRQVWVSKEHIFHFEGCHGLIDVAFVLLLC